MASPFERSPPVQSSTSPPPNPPAVAHLSQSSAATQPQGYTPLNDLSASARAALKGKGRAHNQGWVDLERGAEAGSLVDDEERDMVKDGWERVDGAGGAQVSDTVTEYPPPVAMSEEEREEKRIADNLARMHEKEVARRRAARESKYLKSHGPRAGSGSSSTASANAVGRRNRWSIFGGSDASSLPGGHQPLSYTGSPPLTASPILSPTSSVYASSSSHAAQPVHHEPMSPTLPSASYQGREWIGGGGAQGLQLSAGRRKDRRQLGFWENLCGTGRDRRPGDENDDDSDEDINQGRTNPFE